MTRCARGTGTSVVNKEEASIRLGMDGGTGDDVTPTNDDSVANCGTKFSSCLDN